MTPTAKPFSVTLFLSLTLLAWLFGSALGILVSWLISIVRHSPATPELLWEGVRYGGGIALYLGLQASFLQTLRHANQPERALTWQARFIGFHFIILEISALGGLLGALAFAAVGTLADSHKTAAELIVIGAKNGAFFFLVWAPGFALVRMFMRAAKTRPTLAKAQAGN